MATRMKNVYEILRQKKLNLERYKKKLMLSKSQRGCLGKNAIERLFRLMKNRLNPR